MGMDVGGEKGGAMATPNVVPLIDILLVLIIIFMVITPLTPKGLDTLVPQPSPNQQQNVELENKTVVVQVEKNGKLKINNEDTTWEGLGPRIEQIFKERAEKIAFVKGDNDVMFMEDARAIDIMRGAGIVKFGLVTAKLEAAHDVDSARDFHEHYIVVAFDKSDFLGALLEDLFYAGAETFPGSVFIVDLELDVLLLVRRGLRNEGVQALGRKRRNDHENDNQYEQNINERHHIGRCHRTALFSSHIHPHSESPSGLR